MDEFIYNLMVSGEKMAIVFTISMVLALIGGLLLFFLFLGKKNDGKFTGFLGWMYEFLNFKKMLAENMLKVGYLIMACYITLYAFINLLFAEGGSIGSRFLIFLLTLIIGNVVIRLIFEFSLVILIICRNTTEMNRRQSTNPNHVPKPSTINTIPPKPTPPKPSPSQEIVFCLGCGNKYESTRNACPRCGRQRP